MRKVYLGMKTIGFNWILLGVLLLFTTNTLVAQSFVPSQAYHEIQISRYSASKVHLQTDVRMNGTKLGGLRTATGRYSSTGLAQVGMHVPQQVVTTLSGLGTWKGEVVSIGSDTPNSNGHVMAVRRGVIGGGEEGTPGNPTHVPVGNIPIGWFVLLLSLYTFVRWKQQRKESI